MRAYREKQIKKVYVKEIKDVMLCCGTRFKRRMNAMADAYQSVSEFVWDDDMSLTSRVYSALSWFEENYMRPRRG